MNKKYLSKEAKNILREPLLTLMFFIPLILLFLHQFLIPIISRNITNYFSIDFVHYEKYILILFLIVPTMTVGMLMGFVLVEEKDQEVLEFIKISPFGLKRFLWEKSLITFCLTIGSLVILFTLFLELEINLIMFILIVFFLGIESVIFTILIGYRSKNKVEAMAYGKIMSVIFILPMLIMIIKNPILNFLYLFPQTYVFAFLHKQFNFTLLFGGIFIHLLYIFLGYKFIKKNLG